MSALLTSNSSSPPPELEISVRVYGRSMRPWLRAGSSIKVEPVAYDDLAIGDVAWFARAGSSVLHRVVRRDHASGLWVTRGDAQLGSDGPLDRAALIGRARGLVLGRQCSLGAPRWLVRSAQCIVLGLTPLTRIGVRTSDRVLAGFHRISLRSAALAALRSRILRLAHLERRALGLADEPALRKLLTRAWDAPDPARAALWSAALDAQSSGLVLGAFRGARLVAAARWGADAISRTVGVMPCAPSDTATAPRFRSFIDGSFWQQRAGWGASSRPAPGIPSLASS